MKKLKKLKILKEKFDAKIINDLLKYLIDLNFLSKD
jgi:hypothetical protein